MPPVKVIIWNEGKWLPSKTGSGNNKHVICKTLEDTPREVRLNITDTESFFNGQKVKDVWEPMCKNGNVLIVGLMNERNINKFSIPTLIKDVSKIEKDTQSNVSE